MAAQTDTTHVRSISSYQQSASHAEAVDHRGRLLEEILETNDRRLERFARSIAGSREDGEDAVQQGCLQFCRCYEGSGDPVGWLFLTVKREALAIWRKKGRRRETSLNGFASQPNVEVDLTAILESDGASVEEFVMRQDEARIVRMVLRRLKPDERRALWLLGLGHSYAEIQEVTGWSLTKINRCLAEGRATARQQMAAYETA